VNTYKLNNASSLPDEWDVLADCYFQRKKFLLHCQNWNPCKQRYYVAYENDELIAGAVLYTFRLNLFTYYKISLPLTMQITGIPCSVSFSGLVGKLNNTLKLFKSICSQERGLKLALNIDSPEEVPHNIFAGHTLPVIKFNNHYSSTDDYLKSLRANYRRRLDLINKKSSALQLTQSSCNKFIIEMYHQYIRVYEQSNAKLEQLEYRFFKYLPNEFKLTVASVNGTLAGWFITLNADSELYFFFGGLNYSMNEELGTYHRLLQEIIFQGINSGVQRIDLGQTAEIPKMRLGGEIQPKYMIADHSTVINILLRTSKKLLEYRNTFPQHHVFRNAL